MSELANLVWASYPHDKLYRRSIRSHEQRAVIDIVNALATGSNRLKGHLLTLRAMKDDPASHERILASYERDLARIGKMAFWREELID